MGILISIVLIAILLYFAYRGYTNGAANTAAETIVASKTAAKAAKHAPSIIKEQASAAVHSDTTAKSLAKKDEVVVASKKKLAMGIVRSRHFIADVKKQVRDIEKENN